jgi:hypothetical protein
MHRVLRQKFLHPCGENRHVEGGPSEAVDTDKVGGMGGKGNGGMGNGGMGGITHGASWHVRWGLVKG